jgi:Tol biopolymer transport system component
MGTGMRRGPAVALAIAALGWMMPAAAGTSPANGRIVDVRDPWDGSGRSRVVSMLPDGTDRRLAFVQADPRWASRFDLVALSPDGARLAIVQGRPSRSGRNWVSRLVIVDAADGGNRIVVVPAAQAVYAWVSWYPDGKRLLFTRRSDPGVRCQLYSVVPDGSDLATIGGGSKIQAAMSPDLTRIVYASGRGRLGIMDADGSDPMVLIDDDANLDPAWSPDGSLVALARGVEHNIDLFTIEPDGSNLVRVLQTPHFERLPIWSPDGTRLVFTQMLEDFSRSDLWTIAAGGGGEGQVTDDLAFDTPAGWAPA